MDLITLFVVILVAVVVVYLINKYIPMPAPVRVIFTAIVVTILCCWLMSMAGLGAYISALMGFVVICLIIYLLETLWYLTTPEPRNPTLRNIIYIVLCIVLVIWLLSSFGLIGSLGTLRLPRTR